jgi:hypothetical protein
MALQNVYDSRLGGVMISDLAIGPKVRWFKPGQGDGFLRTVEVRDTPFFGEEVKRSVPCRKIFRHIKNYFEV